MQVILLERVERLGQMGDEVTVKPGYARNFLLPQKKALRATESNRKLFEAQRAQLEAENLKRRDEAEAVAAKLADVKVIMIRAAGESGQLYGSVTSRDISDAVAEAGVTIGRSQVVLNRAIKTLGLHDIDVRLHPEVSVVVVVNIARSEAEAETQFETGSAVIADTGTDELELEVGGAMLDDEDLELDAPADDADVETENAE